MIKDSFVGTQCPITRRPYVMHINHPEDGYVATYGSPYDSYTVPVEVWEGEWYYHRYDHDEGAWVEDEAYYL